jgi:hypothetical protein
MGAVFMAEAESFEQIRTMAAKADVRMKDGVFVEGILVSDFRSLNMGENRQVAWNEVDLSNAYCTAYIQNEDGTAGFRLMFDDIYANRIPRFSKVRIDLSGCLVSSYENAYTIEGISSDDVQIVAESCAPAVRVKHISEITDLDIYTYVTLGDVEFMSKEGSYTNVNEFMVQTSYLNAFKKPKGQDCIDVAGVYLKDNEGESIFLPVSTACDWRRRGDRLPQGVGNVSGIVVPGDYQRYGNVGRYALRISGPSDVAISMEPASNYEVIAEWNWDRNYKRALNLEKQGNLRWVDGKKLSGDDRIIAELGNGYLYTTTPSTYDLAVEYNTRSVHDGSRPGIGSRNAAALRLDAQSADWFAPGAAIVVETSTAGLSGSVLSFDFTWCAGTGKVEESYGYPAEWKVAYSVDGRNYMPLPDVYLLRPIVYEKSPLSYYAAPGYVENTVTLPAFLLGQQKLFIRIFPAGNVAVEKKSDVRSDINTGVFSPEASVPFVLCIGKISLKSLK